MDDILTQEAWIVVVVVVVVVVVFIWMICGYKRYWLLLLLWSFGCHVDISPIFRIFATPTIV